MPRLSSLLISLTISLGIFAPYSATSANPDMISSARTFARAQRSKLEIEYSSKYSPCFDHAVRAEGIRTFKGRGTVAFSYDGRMSNGCKCQVTIIMNDYNQPEEVHFEKLGCATVPDPEGEVAF